MIPDKEAEADGSARLQYPAPCPESVKRLLLPTVKMVAAEFIQGAARQDVLLTDEMLTGVSLSLLGAAVCSAHAVLRNRESLLSEPEVMAWIEAPKRPSSRMSAAKPTPESPDAQRGTHCVQRLVSRKGLIHGIAHCTQCAWSEEDYLTVQKRAAQHARTTGHKVTADLGYIVEYGA